MFFSFLFGFAIAANNIYGPELYDYNDPLSCAKSLLLLLRGSIDYEALVSANEIFTPLVWLAAGHTPPERSRPVRLTLTLRPTSVRVHVLHPHDFHGGEHFPGGCG